MSNIVVTRVRATHVNERNMLTTLREQFPNNSFEVELRNDVYYIKAPRRLSEVSLMRFYE